MTQLTTLLLLSLAIFSASVSGAATTVFPAAAGSTVLSAPIVVSGTYDGGMKRFERNNGCNAGEGGTADAVFHVQSGGTLQNVIIGAAQTEGVHCLGPCTIKNVWWEDVCEDALTIKQSSGTSYIIGGGARNAADKVIQHNGGGTVSVTDFFVSNFGKLYRSCGNCSSQVKRTFIATGVVAQTGSVLAGINTNYGDTATISNTCTAGVTDICQRFTGNSNGDEPVKTGAGNDGTYCKYDSTVTRRSTCV
ncbi:pectate lyase [Tricharina praecox]|uniref:pectate lyase n=1 Tax=Tricharina praecox TaxID=43433 RepID=UPI00222039E7|nr:pectate lyase [Tricharina praecox]KAI5846207.1 pectate lyase [Tricharina praecox]